MAFQVVGDMPFQVGPGILAAVIEFVEMVEIHARPFRLPRQDLPPDGTVEQETGLHLPRRVRALALEAGCAFCHRRNRLSSYEYEVAMNEIVSLKAAKADWLAAAPPSNSSAAGRCLRRRLAARRAGKGYGGGILTRKIQQRALS